MQILIIQNCEGESLGLFEKYFAIRRINCDVFHAYRNSRFPLLKKVDAILVGGTPISVNDLHEHSFLVREHLFLRRAIQTGKPCLGICFGGQILAHALGADVGRSPVMEIGVYQVTLTDSGKRHPLFRNFPDRFEVFHWHGDTFGIPDGGELLAEGNDCRNQAFGFRNVAGLQFHLEVTAVEAARWAGLYEHELVKTGKTAVMVAEEFRQSEKGMAELADRMMENFLAWVREQQAVSIQRSAVRNITTATL
jgi:GMP synthase (glutamine-hydrolysing)